MTPLPPPPPAPDPGTPARPGHGALPPPRPGLTSNGWVPHAEPVGWGASIRPGVPPGEGATVPLYATPGEGAPPNAGRLLRLRFVIAGTAGGVGTTTVAALLTDALAARVGVPPKVIDHSGGDLVLRVAAASPNAEHSVHDLGPHAVTAADVLANGGAHLVIVASPDAECCDTALFALGRLAATAQAVPVGGRLERGVIVINSTSRRRPPAVAAARVAQLAPGAVVIPLPWDESLAWPGPVDPARLAATTTQAAGGIMRAFGV